MHALDGVTQPVEIKLDAGAGAPNGFAVKAEIRKPTGQDAQRFFHLGAREVHAFRNLWPQKAGFAEAP